MRYQINIKQKHLDHNLKKVEQLKLKSFVLQITKNHDADQKFFAGGLQFFTIKIGYSI